MTDDLESRAIRAEEAKQLLANPILRNAWETVAGYLEDKALHCDPDSKDKAQTIILSKQLLASVKHCVERVIEDGEMAKVQMEELERMSLRERARKVLRR